MQVFVCTVGSHLLWSPEIATGDNGTDQMSYQCNNIAVFHARNSIILGELQIPSLIVPPSPPLIEGFHVCLHGAGLTWVDPTDGDPTDGRQTRLICSNA